MTAALSVRYVGYFAEESGYGVAARNHASALATTDVRVLGRSVLFRQSTGILDVLPRPDQSRVVFDLCRNEGDYRIAILHAVPALFPLLVEAGRYNIGVAVWEAGHLPALWRAPSRVVDEVWVASSFSVEAFARATRRPVVVVPHPVEPPPSLPRAFPGIPNDLFLFITMQEWQERKNPLGMVRAFCKAFEGRTDVGFAMKLGRRLGVGENGILDAIRAAMGSSPRTPPIFVFFSDDAPSDVVNRLYARADAYFSLHRAEGFGLCIAEAMAAGLPVVATGYSGSMEYMDASKAFLVDYQLIPVQETLAPWRYYDSKMVWADPSQDSAVDALRACVDSTRLRQRLAAAGCTYVRSYLSPHRIGQLMRQRLREIAAS
jgi:glycosyltransferase involved in cell wall biosynthesis